MYTLTHSHVSAPFNWCKFTELPVTQLFPVPLLNHLLPPAHPTLLSFHHDRILVHHVLELPGEPSVTSGWCFCGSVRVVCLRTDSCEGGESDTPTLSSGGGRLGVCMRKEQWNLMFRDFENMRALFPIGALAAQQ